VSTVNPTKTSPKLLPYYPTKTPFLITTPNKPYHVNGRVYFYLIGKSMVSKEKKCKVSKEVKNVFANDPKKLTVDVKIILSEAYAKEGTKWIRETFFREGISIESEDKENFFLVAKIQKKHIDRLDYSIFVTFVDLHKT
jgi:hypothetical protein